MVSLGSPLLFFALRLLQRTYSLKTRGGRGRKRRRRRRKKRKTIETSTDPIHILRSQISPCYREIRRFLHLHAHIL